MILRIAGVPRALSRARAAGREARQRARTRILRPAYRRAIGWLAARHRARLHDVTFIGITGSCAKTTTKTLVSAVLSSRFPGLSSEGVQNQPSHMARTLLKVRPSHRFYVQEIGVARDEDVGLEASVDILKPHIGVVTHVGTDHISRFGSLEAIAAEKAKLVAALPENGTAVLNADDPNVLAMRARCRGRVLTYGLDAGAAVRATDVQSSWPDRLSFTVHHDGESSRVQTQLLGAHWISSALAAIAVGLAMGVPLDEAARALAGVPPMPSRMSPEQLPGGIDVVRDDCKTPAWSIDAACAFMKDARASRKIIVLGTISDYLGNSDRQYARAARQALEAADLVLFVGPRAGKSLKARRGPDDAALQAFPTPEAAATHLRGLLRPGDLVLLKGGEKDRMGKLLTAAATPGPVNAAPAAPDTGRAGARRRVHAIIGLGNPGTEYVETPHNVGYKVLDALAARLDARWARDGDAMVAGVTTDGAIDVYLIKPVTGMNASGRAVLHLAGRLGFGPADCVLVHDDVDLRAGTVRVRTAGGDGGHRGVRSVVKALETDRVRRVKIGVGRRGDVVSHVLAPIAATDSELIDAACAAAVERVLEVLRTPAV